MLLVYKNSTGQLWIKFGHDAIIAAAHAPDDRRGIAEQWMKECSDQLELRVMRFFQRYAVRVRPPAAAYEPRHRRGVIGPPAVIGGGSPDLVAREGGRPIVIL